MARRKCMVSWCSNESYWRYQGDRVKKSRQEDGMRGWALADDFYKSYWRVCKMHHNDFHDDKNYKKWDKENDIAIEIYNRNWGYKKNMYLRSRR